MLEFKQRVIDTSLNEAISFFEDSPKCHFYKYIYDDHNLQFYLSRPVNYMFRDRPFNLKGGGGIFFPRI